MIGCLDQLNSSTWDGNTCAPKDSNGTPIGPTFGFWKGETHHSSPQDAEDCFEQCYYCLRGGIYAQQAVTTSCQFKSYAALGPAIKWTCDMGFDYGEMQVAPNLTVPRSLGHR